MGRHPARSGRHDPAHGHERRRPRGCRPSAGALVAELLRAGRRARGRELEHDRPNDGRCELRA